MTRPDIPESFYRRATDPAYAADFERKLDEHDKNMVCMKKCRRGGHNI